MKKDYSGHIIIAYIVVAIFVNSYVRNYKWEEWIEVSNHKFPNDAAAVKTIGATIGWPIYFVCKAADKILEAAFSIKVTAEKPEILK